MGEWRTMTLREAGVQLIDCVHQTPTAVEVGYPYITIPQMKNGRIDFSSARHITSADFIEWTKKARPHVHDVVLSRRTNPGVTATFGDHCDFALGQNLVLLRADGRFVRPEFLRWLAVSPSWWWQIEKYNNVGAVFDSLRCADVPRFELPIPSLHDQQAIASILGALDDKIDLNRRMNETLEATARALFKDWFVDFGPTRAKIEGRTPYLAREIWSLFPDLLDNEGKPQGWQFDRLGAFTDLQNGYAFRSADWMAEGVPVVKIGSVKPAVVDLTEVSYISPVLARDRIAFRLNVGDVLVGLTGYVGETGRVPPTISPPMLNQRVARFSSSGTFSPFVYACVRDPDFKTYAEGKAHGSAQANVSTRDLLDYPVINPGVRVFRAFEDLVRPIFDRSLANLGEIASLAATRDLLLPKLISGEIGVRDTERIAEAAK